MCLFMYLYEFLNNERGEKVQNNGVDEAQLSEETLSKEDICIKIMSFRKLQFKFWMLKRVTKNF